jgi:ribosomal protein L18E
MKTGNIDTKLLDNYFSFLKNLSSDNKLELIARLSKSMKTSKKTKKEVSLSSLYGSWESEESADEIIAELKSARNFNNQREIL